MFENLFFSSLSIKNRLKLCDLFLTELNPKQTDSLAARLFYFVVFSDFEKFFVKTTQMEVSLFSSFHEFENRSRFDPGHHRRTVFG